ncbi:hypothetical protein [Promicromonospora aerolata]|uniref:Uncharacterized protein n=1 Tax=Promicromonospora aerolata TaxID=195749 RepID=A0ABW4V2S3_9MICO
MEFLGRLFGFDWSALEAETKVALATALVAVIGTVVASGIGWFVSFVNNRNTLKEQRRLAMEEKVWPRRAETYVEVLEWARQASKHIEEGEKLPLALQSKMAAYASPGVRAAWAKVDNEMGGISGFRLLKAIDEGSAAVPETLALFGNASLGQRVVDFTRQEVQQMGGHEKALRNSYVRLHLRLDDLEREIREDLNGRQVKKK